MRALTFHETTYAIQSSVCGMSMCCADGLIPLWDWQAA